MSTVNPLEVAWTFGALVGLTYAVTNWREALLDLAAVVESGENGALLAMAHWARRTQRERVMRLAAYAFVGFMAMTLADTPGTFAPARTLIAVVFLGLGYRDTFGSYADKRDRRRVIEGNRQQRRNRRSSDPKE